MADLGTDQSRGISAKQVLQNEIYREAWDVVRMKIVDQLENADITMERRNRLNDLLIAHKKAKQYIEQVFETGKMATLEIERQASLAQRVGDRIRQVI